MASATLTEQMGAMSLIDELRHKQMLVQEHLNLPARRQEVASRIREFYAAKGTAVDDALVDQGVRDYFDRRLTFTAPKISKFAASAANLFITRKQWGRKAAIRAAVTITVAGVLLTGARVYDENKTSEASQAISQSLLSAEKLNNEIAQQESSVIAINRQLSAKPLPSASQIMQDVPSGLALAKNLATAHWTTEVTKENRLTALGATNRAETDHAEAFGLLKSTHDKIEASKVLIGARSALNDIAGSSAFISAVASYPSLKSAEADARKSIYTASMSNAPAAAASVRDLNEKLSGTVFANAFAVQKTDLMKQFKAMGLDQDGLRYVTAMDKKASLAIASLDQGAIVSALDEITRTMEYAEAEATLNVVDRGGVKAGVERKEKGTGGKSWFLVVEAVDAAGRVINVPITSNETGKKAMAPMFGVRVTQAEYERVKADKKSDGHVDDRLMGKKPANSLTIEFNDRTTSKPDTILEW